MAKLVTATGLFWAIIFAALPCHVYAQEYAEGPDEDTSTIDRTEYALLWEISGNGLTAPSYLFGTTHLRDLKAFDFPDSLPIVFRQCDAAAFELNPDSAFATFLNPPLWAQKSTHYDEDRFDLDDEFEPSHFGVNTPALQYPFALLQEGIFNRNLEEGDSLAKCFMDIYLLDLAELSGKKIFGLESIWSQTYCHDWADTIKPPLLDWPEAGAKGGKPADEDLERETWFYAFAKETAIKKYLEGDIEKLLAGEAKRWDDEEKRYFIARNYVMAHSIDSIVRHHRLFATMGCAHFGGPKGMIALLRDKGYTVRKMSPEFDGDGRAFSQVGDEREPLAWRPEDGHFSTKIFRTPVRFDNEHATGAKSWIIADEPNALSAYVVEFPLFLQPNSVEKQLFWVTKLLRKIKQTHYVEKRTSPFGDRLGAEEEEEEEAPSPKEGRRARRNKRNELRPLREEAEDPAPEGEQEIEKAKALVLGPVLDTLREDGHLAVTVTFSGSENWHKLRLYSQDDRIWLLAVTARDSAALARKDIGAFFDNFRPDAGRTKLEDRLPAQTLLGLRVPFAGTGRMRTKVAGTAQKYRFSRLLAFSSVSSGGRPFLLRVQDLALEDFGKKNKQIFGSASEPFRVLLGPSRRPKEEPLWNRFPSRKEEFRMDSVSRLCVMSFRRGGRVYTFACEAGAQGWQDPTVKALVDSIAVLPLEIGQLSSLRVDSVGFSVPFPAQRLVDDAEQLAYLFPYSEDCVKHWAVWGADSLSGAYFVVSAHDYNPFAIHPERDSAIAEWAESAYEPVWKSLLYSQRDSLPSNMVYWSYRDTLTDGSVSVTLSGRDSVSGISLRSRFVPRGDKFFTWHAFFPQEIDTLLIERQFLDSMVFLAPAQPITISDSMLKERVLEALVGKDSMRMVYATNVLNEIHFSLSDSDRICTVLDTLFLQYHWSGYYEFEMEGHANLFEALDSMPSKSRDKLYWRMFSFLPEGAFLWNEVLDKMLEAKFEAVLDSLIARPGYVKGLEESERTDLIVKLLGGQKSKTDTLASKLLRVPELFVATMGILAKRKQDNLAKALFRDAEPRLLRYADSLYATFFEKEDLDSNKWVQIGWNETEKAYNFFANRNDVGKNRGDTIYRAAEALRAILGVWKSVKELPASTMAFLQKMSEQTPTKVFRMKALLTLMQHGQIPSEAVFDTLARQMPVLLHQCLSEVSGQRLHRQLPARVRSEAFGVSLTENIHLADYPSFKPLGPRLLYLPWQTEKERFFVYFCADTNGRNYLLVSPGYPSKPNPSRVYYNDGEFKIIRFRGKVRKKKDVERALLEEGYNKKPHE